MEVVNSLCAYEENGRRQRLPFHEMIRLIYCGAES